jgi:hypothetical protein
VIAGVVIAVLITALVTAAAKIFVLRRKVQAGRDAHDRTTNELAGLRTGFGFLAEAHEKLQTELARVASDRDNWRTRHSRSIAAVADLRLRGRILPDITDELDLLLFDDRGPSPIFASVLTELIAAGETAPRNRAAFAAAAAAMVDRIS